MPVSWQVIHTVRPTSKLDIQDLIDESYRLEGQLRALEDAGASEDDVNYRLAVARGREIIREMDRISELSG